METITSIKDFFTDEEWDAINDAMGDYQDYGDHETKMCDSIRNKIHQLFKD